METHYEQNLEFSYSSDLVTQICGQCGIIFAMPVNFKQERLDDHNLSFYCPAGHCRVYSGKTKVQKLKEELKVQIELKKHYITRAHTADRRASAYKGQVTKVKKRVKNGVCPCCNRSFVNLMRHMHGQHPDWKE